MDAEQLACTPEEIRERRKIARSTHAGIWRIKRAKVILGTIEGRTVQELVLDVRVVPESIKKCLQQFAEKRMRFFDKPHRVPTWRETAAERVLLLPDPPPPKRSKKWDQVKVRYYGRDFSAREIEDIRELIASEPQWPRPEECETAVTEQPVAHKIPTEMDNVARGVAIGCPLFRTWSYKPKYM